MGKILVTGSVGQIGSELTPALRKKFGKDNVVAMYNRTEPTAELKEGPVVKCDVTDKDALKKVLVENEISEIYHLVGILSATGEEKPQLAWDVNMGSLKNVFDLSVELKVKKVFWASSIAVFGPTTPRDNTPQSTIIEPSTMYGVTKLAGEHLGHYYYNKFGLDIRSLRYPGLISWKTPPGGGTTDYSVAIFYEGLQKGSYECFVSADTVLPMMYMDDAIKGTIDLMDADASLVHVRTSYNHAAISFSAKELADEVKKHIPGLTVTYKPDSRQKIADSWPRVIDDSQARKDWGWSHEYDLPKMTEDMIVNLKKKLGG